MDENQSLYTIESGFQVQTMLKETFLLFVTRAHGIGLLEERSQGNKILSSVTCELKSYRQSRRETKY